MKKSCIVLAFVILMANCALVRPALAGTQSYKIGEDRSGEQSKLFVPNNYKATKAWPLIVLLHGYSANQEWMDDWFGYKDQAEKRGFLLITGEGLKDSSGLRYWNATDGCCDFDHRGNDDVAYIKSLIAITKGKFRIDPKRIYVAGHSNGGFMAHRLACEMSDAIAAIVSFAGETWLDPQRCQPIRPVSVLQIQALDDDTINYNGDSVGYPQLAGYPGAVQTTSRWAAYDGCRASVVGSKMNLTLSIDGKDATPTVYQKCAAGTSVELWTIDAHKAPLYSGHTPLLSDDFTTRTLDFILQKHRE